MADRDATPDADEAVLRLARQLARWRQRFAPPGSPQSRLARGTVELFRRPAAETARLRQRYLAWDEPRARFATWDGAAPSGRLLPDRPRILVLKLDHIGDLVVAQPALRRLREAFPAASFTLVCGRWNVALAEAFGGFDRVVAFNVFDTNRQIDPHNAAVRFAALDLGRYDLAIDLRHEPDTRPLLMAADATWRAGFQAPAPAGGGRLDVVVPDSQDALRAAGAEPLHAGVRLEVLAAAVAASFGRRIVVPEPGPLTPPYAVLAPGAGAPIKRWPLERLSALAAGLIADHDLDIAIVGGDADIADGTRLAADLPTERVRDLTGMLPLPELPTLLRGARLFVGYDSGPTHLSAALGVPTVCVFAGVSDAAVWHPVGPAVTIVAGSAGCSPCRLTEARECPNQRACLTVISADAVLAACSRRLGGSA
jgi:ADP-heptose:LPS heptosyltransferase